MTSRDFCYWLQGYIEIGLSQAASKPAPSPDQFEIIRNHLNMVFAHEIDPSHGNKEMQAELSALHDKTKEDPWIIKGPPKNQWGGAGSIPGGKLRC